VPNEAPSLRESIESAMNAQAEAEPVEAAPVEAAAEVPAPSAEAPNPAAADRARDETGRFAKAEKAAEKPAAAPKGAEKAGTDKAAAAGKGTADGAVTPPVPSAPPAQAAPVKVPQSWKPHMRELAAKLPAEFHPLIEESLRRDGEVTRALQETAEARRFAETVQRQLSPFEGVARASGMDVMSYAGSVMQTAAQLFQGPQGGRAELIAKLIKQAGVNPEDVNPYLTGERAAPQQAAPAQPQPNIDEIVERRLTERDQRAEAERTKQAIAEFTATQPEFLNDVYTDMVAIIEAGKRTGRNVTLQQAYDRACRMNEDVAQVLEKRKATEAARAQAPTVQRAKVAASSIKPSAAAATPRQSSGAPSLRDTIEAAVAGQRT
jgi:hypothetical protein